MAHFDGSEETALREMQTLSAGLAQFPGKFGISPEDAAETTRLVEALESAMAVANDLATRTQPNVAAKRAALNAAKKHCRRLASYIRLNPSLSAEDLSAIGLTPKGEKRRTPPPTTTPMLAIAGIVPGGHEIEMFDSQSPDRRGRPHPQYNLELMVAYSPNHGEGLGMESIVKSGQPIAVLTRMRATVTHADERVGSVANYIGRWVNNRREAGPWSQPVRMVLAMPGGQAKRLAA